MPDTGWTNIRTRGRKTRLHVSKDLMVGDQEIAGRLFHSLPMFVADPDDLGVRTIVCHAQEIAHMEMVKVDPRDFPSLGHTK